MALSKTTPEKFGWRIREWGEAAGLSRSQVYAYMKENKIASVKAGSSRIITTHPAEFLASLAKAA